MIYRSAAKGHSHPVETIQVHTDEPETIERTLTLAPFIDGGWYWFDIVAGASGTTLIEAEWAVQAPPTPPGTVSMAITIVGAPDYLFNQLRAIGEAPEVLDILDTVYVADQGPNKIKNHPDFADATKKLGDRLKVIEQGNLGGSGGFSRGMDETLRAGRSEYVLIMDDDIMPETEGVLRAAAFADLTHKPTIVGAHMFSMYDPSVLHAYAEVVGTRKWWWGAAPNTKARHDFGRRNLRNTPWLHRRAESDYNGWWMCMIPMRIVREIGLAIPVFIKWDDAEYALRARAAGYPTVSMPGVAAWHVPWLDKNDAQDWQAYYHLRNRVVTALLHSPLKHGGALVSESAERQLQNLLSMQYSTAALRMLAIEDVLTGPEHLHRDLPVKMAQLRELRMRYADAQTQRDVYSFPLARRKPAEYDPPTSKFGLADPADRRAVAPVPAGAPGGQEPAAGGAAAHRRALVRAVQAGQRRGLHARRHQRVLVPAGPEAAAPARLAQRDAALAAAAAVAEAGRSVPRGGARIHLTRAVARDLRPVGR